MSYFAEGDQVMSDIVIASAVRTAIGSFGGSLSGLSAPQLGEVVIRESLGRAKVDAAEVNDVIFGQVLTGGSGQNPARQAAIFAGLPIESTAMTINQVCGSGLRTVALAYQSILAGDASIVIAGGQESMTNSTHASFLRNGVKMGNLETVDTMIKDGLTDVFNGYHMGITAENVAREFQISREEQDAFAAASQQKAIAAITEGRFKEEIVPVKIMVKKEERLFDTDEFPKAGTTAESLGKLRAAFDKAGTVTAGNASGINDGAAALVIMTAAEAAKRGITPLARIASWATAGVDPKVMGTGPIPAVKKALLRAGWKLEDLDVIEANEAFASQAIAVNKGLGWDTSKVNLNGGAIALGHPIGASGARVLVSLLHQMKRSGGKKGVATLCIGGGMGIALTVER
jgi:acetyl-CoA C-acetyltransferase